MKDNGGIIPGIILVIAVMWALDRTHQAHGCSLNKAEGKCVRGNCV